MKYLSLFSGIGGFEIGIDRAIRRLQQEVEGQDDSQDNQNKRGLLNSGATCIGYSEIDPYADAIYKYNFGGHNYGDCTKIDPTTIPDFDLLVGGFPCQAFSIAGKRGGFDDTRGTLIYDVFRILKEKQPRHFILENVKGLLSHDSGGTFKTIITSLAELGYAVEWQVLNAKNFGVPQNRERVFIVGHLGGFGGRQVFPIRKPDRETINQYFSVLTPHTYDLVKEVYGKTDGYVESKPLVIAPTIDANYYKGVNRNPGHASSNRGILDNAKIRRLTPTECERLMGLPDDWTRYGWYKTSDMSFSKDPNNIRNFELGEVKEMSDTRRYKACGNGIVTNVVEEVVRRLYAHRPEHTDEKPRQTVA